MIKISLLKFTPCSLVKCCAGEVREKISWTDRVRNEVLHTVEEKKSSPYKIKRRPTVLVIRGAGTAF